MTNLTNLSLRHAVQQDLPRLNEIYNWAVLHSVATFDLVERTQEEAERWFLSHQDPFYPLLVAENNGEVLGWGSLSPFHPRPAYKESGEFSIYIAPNWRGHGIGDLLLNTLCEYAKDIGYHTLLGLITATNEASLKLAQKHGFVETGRYCEVGYKFKERLDVIVVQNLFSVKE